MDEDRDDQTTQGCLPALWNAVGNELGAPGQGCLLMMIPLIMGGLRLIVEAWDWRGPVQQAMGYWLFGVFLGGIGLGHEGLELAPKLRRIGVPTRRVAIGLVVATAAIVTWLAPATDGLGLLMLPLGAVFGLFGASWLGL